VVLYSCPIFWSKLGAGDVKNVTLHVVYEDGGKRFFQIIDICLPNYSESPCKIIIFTVMRKSNLSCMSIPML
jgi:hypothetical protein